MARIKAQTRKQRIDDACQRARDAATDLRCVAEEYQEWFDNMPDNLQQSPTAEKCENAHSELDGAADEIESACDDADGVELPIGFGRD